FMIARSLYACGTIAASSCRSHAFFTPQSCSELRRLSLRLSNHECIHAVLAQAQRRCQFVRPMMAWSRQEPDVQQQRFDITDRRDVACLVNVFYDRVRDDDLLGPIFDDVAHVDWATHLPRMDDFWESVLFSTATFKGTPLVV